MMIDMNKNYYIATIVIEDWDAGYTTVNNIDTNIFDDINESREYVKKAIIDNGGVVNDFEDSCNGYFIDNGDNYATILNWKIKKI